IRQFLFGYFRNSTRGNHQCVTRLAANLKLVSAKLPAWIVQQLRDVSESPRIAKAEGVYSVGNCPVLTLPPKDCIVSLSHLDADACRFSFRKSIARAIFGRSKKFASGWICRLFLNRMVTQGTRDRR